ncbi:MAG: ATP-grasp domain-containing protein [Candidatus Omnitrophota bacterium]
MNKISEYLRDKYGPWGWLGQRAHDACGINQVLPLDFIISCDYGTEIPYYFRQEDVYSIEKKNGLRKDWSNEDLNTSLKGNLGREISERWNSYNSKVNLLCYRSVRRLENGKGRYQKRPRLFAVPQSLKKRFDNKALLHKNLTKLSMPCIPGMVDRIAKADFNDLRKILSLPFVVQFPYGSSGHYTFGLREEKDYDELRNAHPDATALIRRYIDGFSLNVNAVIVSSEEGPRVMCSSPSVQITGIPECSNSPASFCGNDYAAAKDLDRSIVRQVETHMQTVGKWMAASGFRGIFGMDFVLKDGTIYPVEINPRFQNSTSLYTVLSSMSRSRKGTLFLLHIAEFLQKEDKFLREYLKEFPERELMRPLNGSQLILHNRMRKNIITGELAPGVYKRDGRELKLVRQGASLNDCRNGGELLITCGVPRPYLTIEPNAALLKIQMRDNILDVSNKRRLTPEAKKVVSLVYEKIGLKSANKIEVARSV